MSSPDLFTWADAQPVADAAVIDFRARRDHLPRWQWWRANYPWRHHDMVIDREDGIAPPAPILAFPRRPPASPEPYRPDNSVRLA